MKSSSLKNLLFFASLTALAIATGHRFGAFFNLTTISEGRTLLEHFFGWLGLILSVAFLPKPMHVRYVCLRNRMWPAALLIMGSFGVPLGVWLAGRFGIHLKAYTGFLQLGSVALCFAGFMGLIACSGIFREPRTPSRARLTWAVLTVCMSYSLFWELVAQPCKFSDAYWSSNTIQFGQLVVDWLAFSFSVWVLALVDRRCLPNFISKQLAQVV